jgi:dephospho-CoA kinase
VTRVVALTGNVAAGKSSVSDLFREWGATIIDADRLVRELQQPGQPVFERIVARFGPGIRSDDGTLDRDALRRLVLDDPTARLALERIVHPAVATRREELIRAAQARGVALVVVDIPLLFEADDPQRYHAIVLVDAPVATRRERLVGRRGMDAHEADLLMASQLPSGPKRVAAHHVIDNDGDLVQLAERSRRVWEALQR